LLLVLQMQEASGGGERGNENERGREFFHRIVPFPVLRFPFSGDRPGHELDAAVALDDVEVDFRRIHASFQLLPFDIEPFEKRLESISGDVFAAATLGGDVALEERAVRRFDGTPILSYGAGAP